MSSSHTVDLWNTEGEAGVRLDNGNLASLPRWNLCDQLFNQPCAQENWSRCSVFLVFVLFISTQLVVWTCVIILLSTLFGKLSNYILYTTFFLGNCAYSANHEIGTGKSMAKQESSYFSPWCQRREASKFLFSKEELSSSPRGSDRLRSGSLQADLSLIV